MRRGRVRRSGLGVFVALLALGVSAACAGSTTGPGTSAAPSGTSTPESVLFVQDAAGATLDLSTGTLTLVGAHSEITYFADRPARSAGHVPTRAFIDRWTALFGADPPNAGLQAVDAAGTAQPMVVELLGAPTLADGTIAFKVKADGPTKTTGRTSLRDVSLFIDGGNPAGLPAAAPVSATSSATSHTVTVVNRSNNYQSLVIYQKPPAGDSGVQSLAWLTATSWPQSTVTFTWSEDYAFVWGPDGELLPGVVFQAVQSVDADPSHFPGNSVVFGRQNGSLALTQSGAGFGTSGSLLITSDPNVPIGQTAVGVAMNGSPVFATPALPSAMTVFELGQPQYFLAAGVYQQGQVLDLPAMTNSTALNFQPQTNDLLVTLQPNGSWGVLPN